MSFRKAAKKIVRSMGLDVVRRDPLRDPLIKLIAKYRIDLVFDVGANEGQYMRYLREIGYMHRIVSFEPLSGPFAVLSRRVESEPLVIAVNLALGNRDGLDEINVAKESVFSSFLELEPALQHSKPQSMTIGRETIQVRRLDAVFEDYASQSDRVFLKIDTQGFEKCVLEGATASLGRILGVQVEMSIIPLYGGETVFGDMVPFLRVNGFELMELVPVARDHQTGRLLQVDGIFFRLNERR